MFTFSFKIWLSSAFLQIARSAVLHRCTYLHTLGCLSGRCIFLGPWQSAVYLWIHFLKTFMKIVVNKLQSKLVSLMKMNTFVLAKIYSYICMYVCIQECKNTLSFSQTFSLSLVHTKVFNDLIKSILVFYSVPEQPLTFPFHKWIRKFKMEQISLRLELIIFRGRGCDFSLEKILPCFFHQVECLVVI